jgi:hypothetical protein
MVFNLHIGIDYSGRETPVSRTPGLQVYAASGNEEPRAVRPHKAPEEPDAPHAPERHRRRFRHQRKQGAAKLKAIRTMLKVHPLDHQWTLPSRMADNPMIWLLEVNGLLVDIRHAPREVQEIAFKKGLIPYIPPDRQ